VGLEPATFKTSPTASELNTRAIGDCAILMYYKA